MRRTSEAVDATMFATSVGIDAAIKGNVRGIVAGDDAFGGVHAQGGFQRRRLFFKAAPANEEEKKSGLVQEPV